MNTDCDNQDISPSSVVDPPRWYDSTFLMGLLSGLLLWLAFPPFDWGPLAWFAPLGWLLLIHRKKLIGRRPYLKLYVVGWLYFGATFYWIMLPHAAAILGWIALTTYLACYLPAFIFFARFSVHTQKVPLVFAAPIVWTGMEFIRAHLITGFLMAALAHTQHRSLAMIQISDLFGAYGLTFLLMLTAASVASLFNYGGAKRQIWPLLFAASAVLAALFYGQQKLHSPPGDLGPRVAVIQGSIDTQFDRDPRESRRLIEKEYLQLTREALQDPDPIAMIIWPESMATIPLIKVDKNAWLPAKEIANWEIVDSREAALLETAQRLPDAVYQLQKYSEKSFASLSRELHRMRSVVRPEPFAFVVGTNAEHYRAGKIDRYNTSLFLGPEGTVRGRYDKKHLVLFGEYVPLGNWIPALYDWTPLMGGLTPGKNPTLYEISGTGFAPSICYESVLPHVIRRQLLELKNQGRPADVLLSQTNDGWFWGSSALDMHLICGIFRAVEFRKPLIISANTGFSASISGRGQVLAQGPRRKAAVLFVAPRLEPLESIYLVLGDILGAFCLTFVLVAGVWILGRAIRDRVRPC